ncbi:MAG: metallophosphoesterase [Elusimicrobia bacterium]|nr:metallophosphoesterase [Elusimicrobiota bacterium]
MNAGKFAFFLTIVLTIWTALHFYVFWRLSSLPWIAAHFSRRAIILTAALLWAGYPLARILSSHGMETVVWPLEFVAANWIGVLLLLFCAVFAVDLMTLGGRLFPNLTPVLRGGAVIAAIILSAAAIAQGLRAPVVRDYDVPLAGLPAERGGLTLILISDTHLGTLIGPRWMARLAGRVNDLRPDMVVIAGDLLDANAGRSGKLLDSLKILRAPLGVFAVTGNHDYYAGVQASVDFMQKAGFKVLRDEWVEAAPGLAIAGVDDLTARRQFGADGYPVEKALAGRPKGAVILISHTPWQAETAAAYGAGLMLSGHTHGGQLWPFGLMVARRYPLMAGRYEVKGMPVIVCRGSGTWGPRMRLWRPSEIIRIKLI